MSWNKQPPEAAVSTAVALYYVIIAALAAAAYFPLGRVWGINQWAYFSPLAPVCLLAVAAVIPPVIRRLTGSQGSDADAPRRDSLWSLTALVVVVLLALSFYFVRAKTHFLGDGYLILEKMTAAQPFLKATESGEVLVHLWLRTLLGADGPTASLASYQITSIFSGLCFLAAALLFARSHFGSARDRLLFILGMASGGYMLLFYGYVENYALFVLAVAGYTLAGISVATGVLSRGWVVVPLAFAGFFHVLGVSLVPSALYLIMADSKASRLLRSPAKPVRWPIVGTVAVGAAFVFYRYYATSLFFRLAFLPPMTDRFTIEGYTLFSPAHLADSLNLLFLLVPGVPLLATLIVPTLGKPRPGQRVHRFLALLIISTLGAVFILDPKLGMPRDWDLFSFAGIPLAASLYYFVLNNQRSPSTRKVAALAIALGLLVLVPRVVGHSVPVVAISHFKNYLKLDKIKNRAGRQILITYLRKQGQSDKADHEVQQWKEDFPEVSLATYGNKLAEEGKLDAAIAANRQAIAINPIFWISYSNIGVFFLNRQQYDSAAVYLEIADGLNPFNTVILNNLGYAYTNTQRFDKAERVLLYSHSLDTAKIEPILNLLQLYRAANKTDKFYHYLLVAASKKDAPPEIFKELGDHYLDAGDYSRASALYDSAMNLGFDSAIIREIKRGTPQLNSP